ncbi:MAG: phosphoribosylamine--glycine ligase [Bacteroidota bacterium]
MNILILGSGGREHTFAWKIKQSPLCESLFIAPGNAGTQSLGENVTLDLHNFEAIGAFCLNQGIELVVVGPEAPLVAGITDHFLADPVLQGIQVVGPTQKAAQLEGSKAFAKVFMEKRNIPTAAYREFTPASLPEGLAYIRSQKPPYVLKADGLAAGKGVLILNDTEQACEELALMLDGKFGDASSRVVIEEFLDGIEFSVFVLTDGKSYQLLPEAKDYKRIGEGDTGLNTGGMGAVSPVPFVSEEIMHKVTTRIIEPTVRGLQEDGLRYEGFIFFGLILVQGEPYVIEYNCRMGDPETEVVFPRLQSDLVPLMQSIKQGTLAQQQVTLDPRSASTVMLVSGGYPGSYEKGKVIDGLDIDAHSLVFHAGTKAQGQQIVTNGGRVLAITSYGNHFKEALEASYQTAEQIQFAGKNFRSDIGFDL